MKWIRISEQEPPEGVYILLSTNDGKMAVGEKVSWGYAVDDDLIQTDSFGNPGVEMDDITHWAYLPDAPNDPNIPETKPITTRQGRAIEPYYTSYVLRFLEDANVNSNAIRIVTDRKLAL